MATLHLFNPENDLALAAGNPYFTPPKAAVALARAGAVLPVWWSQPGDAFIGTESDERWLTTMRCKHFLPATRYISQQKIDYVAPWGWSAYTKQKLIRSGIPKEILPTQESLDGIRRLSHRNLTCRIYRELRNSPLPYPLPPDPQEVSSIIPIHDRLERGELCFLKSPWSSSGRGIIDSRHISIEHVLRLAKGIISRQGSIMIETALEKVIDFAMLLDMTGGKAKQAGLSLFFNSSTTSYEGNLLDSPKKLLQRLTDYVPSSWITDTCRGIAKALEATVGTTYNGPVGVDMLIFRQADGSLSINPCVEVNMRMTMGRVAHEIYKRHITANTTAIMRIVRGAVADSPDILMRLTPPNEEFNFIVTSL